jgi:hypothetical protein
LVDPSCTCCFWKVWLALSFGWSPSCIFTHTVIAHWNKFLEGILWNWTKNGQVSAIRDSTGPNTGVATSFLPQHTITGPGLANEATYPQQLHQRGEIVGPNGKTVSNH